jgi:hypothetical protein
MLSSIHPLGERGRGQPWAVTVGFYVAGSAVGGALLGAGAGLVGAPLFSSHPGAARVAAALALVLAAAGEATGVTVPSLRRQVNEDWLHSVRGWVYGLGFGVQLGAGLVTIVTSLTTYALAVVAACTASVGPAAAAGAAFGLARALPVLLARRVVDARGLARLHRRLHRAHGPARAVAAVVAGGLGAAVLIGGAA